MVKIFTLCSFSIWLGAIGLIMAWSGYIALFLIRIGIIFRPGIEVVVFAFIILSFPINIMGIVSGLNSLYREDNKGKALIGILLNSHLLIFAFAFVTFEIATLLGMSISMNGRPYGDAAFRLAEMYEKGQGVPQDFTEAAKLYRLTVFDGEGAKMDTEAAYRLGDMHDKGRGVRQNHAIARKWYRFAGRELYHRGWIYAAGYGSGGNVEAYKWFSLAAALGEPKAKEDIPTLARKMTEEEVSRAQALAVSWRKEQSNR